MSKSKEAKIAEIKKVIKGGKVPEVKSTSIPRSTDKQIETPTVVIGEIDVSTVTKTPDKNTFVKFGEDKPISPFKRSIVVETAEEPFIGIMKGQADDTITVPLDILSYVSLQSSIEDIKREVKSRFNIVKNVEWDEKFKTFVAELKLDKCIKEEELHTVTDFNGFIPTSMVDTSILTDEVKSILHPNYKNVNTRGNSLVLVLGIDELISNVLVKSYLTGLPKENFDLEKHVTLSNTYYKNDTLFYMFAFKEMPKESTFISARANFVALNLSATNERMEEVLYDRVLSKIDKDCKCKYVESAPIYREADDHNPLIKKEYINGRAETPMEAIPMVQISASYNLTGNSYKNPFMNSFLNPTEQVLNIDTAKIKNIFKNLIPQGTVMGYLVDNVPYLLVDTRVLIASAVTDAIYGMKASVLSEDGKTGFILHI